MDIPSSAWGSSPALGSTCGGGESLVKSWRYAPSSISPSCRDPQIERDTRDNNDNRDTKSGKKKIAGDTRLPPSRGGRPRRPPRRSLVKRDEAGII